MLLSRRSVTPAALLFWLSAAPLTPPSASATIYTYIDESGVQVFTNQLHSIPARYRNQLTMHEFDEPLEATQEPVHPANIVAPTADGKDHRGDPDKRAAAARPTPEDEMEPAREQAMSGDQQAAALGSQAWTSWTYPTLGFYSYPWFGVPGINGLLLQPQRLSPHRHLPPARQTIPGPTSPPPLLKTQGQPAKVGDVVVMPKLPQPQLHPNHFWRPSPPNIQSAPSIPSPNHSVSPQRYGDQRSLGGGNRAAKGR